MGAIASQITILTIVFSTVYLDTGQRKHQCSASLAFVRGIHRRAVNSPHKWPVTRKMFPFDDVILQWSLTLLAYMYHRNREALNLFPAYFCDNFEINECQMLPVVISCEFSQG